VINHSIKRQRVVGGVIRLLPDIATNVLKGARSTLQLRPGVILQKPLQTTTALRAFAHPRIKFFAASFEPTTIKLRLKV
jgi:hypothetical protein